MMITCSMNGRLLARGFSLTKKFFDQRKKFLRGSNKYDVADVSMTLYPHKDR
jgi:hypothetical protein